MRNKLSVTIITLNEEEKIGSALDSVKKVADEVVLVDSGSTDKTIKIAKRHGSKVFTRKFDNYASQKNFALKKASGDWILSLDADEEVTPNLAKEIESAIGEKGVNAYTIPRKNFILGKFIKHARWQPELDRHIWLWKKGKGAWKGKVHEEVVVEGKVGKLENPKIHRHNETVFEFWNMMNTYSSRDASQRIEEGTRFSYFRLFFDPLYNFLVRFFYRGGFLDGWRGFSLSYLMAIYHFNLWIKIWEAK